MLRNVVQKNISIAEARIQLADLEQKILEMPGGYLPEFCGVKFHFLRLISGSV